jgi:hypothetical protein
MKHTIQLTLSAFLALVVVTSCNKDVLRGEGPTKTEIRTLPAFNTVHLSGIRHAEIVYSTESKVELTGYQNLVDVYSQRVLNGELEFMYLNHTNVRNDNIRLRIYTPIHTKISMSGNTKATVLAGFSNTRYEALLSGNSELRFGGGTVDRLELETSGNAEVYARPLQAVDATASVSGNGRIELQASRSANITISGNGAVHYWGNPPQVVASVSGNGRVVKH